MTPAELERELGSGKFRSAYLLAGTEALFLEVSLYGALIHVAAEDIEMYKSRIERLLSEKGIAVTSMQLIAPSLEDVFIASVNRESAQMSAENISAPINT